MVLHDSQDAGCERGGAESSDAGASGGIDWGCAEASGGPSSHHESTRRSSRDEAAVSVMHIGRSRADSLPT